MLDSLASKDTTSHTPLDLQIKSLIVRRGAIKFNRHDIAPTAGRFNANHLAINNLSTHVILNELTDSTLDVAVKKLSFAEQSGINLNQLKLRFHADKQKAVLRQLVVRMPGTAFMSDSIKATYLSEGKKILMPSLKFNGNISNSYITLSDIKSLIPELSSFNNTIYLHSSFAGTSTGMNLKELELYSKPEGIEVSINGSVSNFEHPHWHTNIHNLSLSAKTLDFIARNMNIKSLKMPEEVVRLGNVNYQGEAGGVGSDLSTRGVLRTDAGEVNLGVGIRNGLFSGQIETNKFDLKRILDNNDFGFIGTHVDVDGNLKALGGNKKDFVSVKGTISNIDYKAYTYNDIHLDGTYQNETFDGALNINDPNGAVDIKGIFKTTLKEPVVNIHADVKNLDLAAMKITEQWKGKRLSAKIDADFGGSSLNKANGVLNIEDFMIDSKEDSYQLEKLNIEAGNHDGERLTKLSSDFAEITIRGDYDYKTLLKSLANHVANKLPTMPGLPDVKSVNKNNFTISASISKTDWLQSMFGIPVILHEPMYLYGRVNDQKQDLNIECSIPSVSYDGSRYEDARVSITSPNDTLHADVFVKKIMDNGHKFSLNVAANAHDNQLSTLIHFNNHRKHAFKGSIDAVAQFFNDNQGKATAHVNVNESEILVNDTIWTVQPSDIIYTSKNIVIDHFAISHHKQHLIISGLATQNNSDSLIVDLQDVDVNYLTNLVNFHAVEFGGLATGRACVKSAFDNPSAYANLIVNHFTFENGRMGTLHADVEWNKEEKQIDIKAIADDRPYGQTLINGFVSPEKNRIDLAIDPQGSRMEFLESFCGSFMDNVDIQGTGNLRLHGPLDAINLTGQAVVNGKLDITSLNTTYWLRNDTVRLIPNEIVFQADTIYDKDNNIGIVSGALHHQCLTNLSYDMNISANNLLAYDFKDYNGSTFFGTVWATGNCAIHGKSGEIVMDINVKPEKGSFIEYNASAPDAITNQEFIEWNDISPNHQNQSVVIENDSIPHHEEVEGNENYDITSDLRLNFLIDCTPDATLRVLMDHNSGDYIALNGNGTIRATYFNKGSFDMFGTYLVDHGAYKLTIQNVIKKDFQFQQGGTIVFGGDPYNAVLNLKALYTVNGVPLSDLNIGNSFSNNNIRVDCIMNITGNPLDPKVDFDIDLPTVNSDAKQMVKSIINGQEEMNQQVIYLLGIGRFYTLEGNNAAGGANQQSQTSLAMQSLLSGTISQQINSVLSTVIKNNNWNFGANISTGDEGWNNAEYEGLLSGRLLNNRLLINGQFGYRDNANATTSFIGDFDIRYLLFPNGNLSLKVYNQTNDRYFTKNSLNTQGIGLLMKKDFNNWRELFRWKKKKFSVKKY